MPRGGKRAGAGRRRRVAVSGDVSTASTTAVAASSSTAVTVPQAPASTPVPPIANPHGLAPKELLFVEAYCGISRFNASHAYLIAGFKGKPGKVGGLAARLIARDRVSKAIAEKLGSRLQTLQMDGDEALEGISRIGRADIRKILTADGGARDLTDLDDDIADAIQSVKIVERKTGDGPNDVEYIKEFKLYDKLKARELMAKVAGKLSEKVDHKHSGSVELAWLT